MLVEGVNDSDDHVREVSEFLAELKPARAYLSIPTRPPAEAWVGSPSEQVTNRAYQAIRKSIDHVECLIGYEGNAFAFTGDVEEDLLSITAVHPMRAEAVGKFLERARADWSTVDKLVDQGELIQVEYERRRFYMRRLHRSRRHEGGQQTPPH